VSHLARIAECVDSTHSMRSIAHLDSTQSVRGRRVPFAAGAQNARVLKMASISRLAMLSFSIGAILAFVFQRACYPKKGAPLPGRLVKRTVDVGRSPYEAFFTADWRELWVSIRARNYVSVIDPMRLNETSRIEVADGPDMTMVSPDRQVRAT
jgi:hypothetical protein